MVAGIFVRVIFYRELAIGFPDFFGIGILADAQNLIVIALGHLN
jgi:hypothetical protein